jgi:hypothetical protein
MFLPLLICLLVSGGLFIPSLAQPAAAADGYSISNGSGPNTRPSMNISPNNSKVCVVWSTFGQGADAFVRIYYPGTGAWSPDLSQSAFLVSQNAGNDVRSGTTRCAIDALERVHVVWTEVSGERLRHSMLSANADPSNPNNWTSPVTVATVADTQHPDVASIFADAAGKIWLAYWSLEAGGSVYVKSWTNGSGWSGDEKASDGTGQFPRIGVDNAGYVHVIYKQAGIRYTYRDVATGVWSASVQVPGSGDAVPHAGLAVNRNAGDVHVVYSTGSSDDTRAVRHSKKAGSTGTAFNGFQTLTGPGNYVVPRLAWSASGKLTMVADNRTNGTIDVATSSNNGDSWSGATTIGDAPGEGWPSVTMDGAGNSYITYWKKDANDSIIFVQLGNAAPDPATRFADVPTSYWAYAQIESFAAKGRTTGCGDDAQGRRLYCPDSDVTRAEMAVFITRTLGQDQVPATGQTFADVPPTYWAYQQIERFAQLGITTGCGTDDQGRRLYCPDSDVTRAEMAVFITRAKGQDQVPATGQTSRMSRRPTGPYQQIERFAPARDHHRLRHGRPGGGGSTAPTATSPAPRWPSSWSAPTLSGASGKSLVG